MAFLALQFRRTLRKLQYSALEIMFYYFALWVVATLLLLRAVAQVQPFLSLAAVSLANADYGEHFAAALTSAASL